MTIKEIKIALKSLIDEPMDVVSIEKNLFSEDNGRKKYNNKIRQIVKRKFGIYIWFDSSTNEIVYIGMAGKIKTDGSQSDHSIQNRLLASRGKDKITKKDIQTNDFVHNIMNKYEIETLNIYILYSKPGEPPAYLEALLLYTYFKKNNCLPKLNISF